MTTHTSHGTRHASSEGNRHPLDTREKRTPVNYALRAKGIPAKACSVCWVIKSTSLFNRKSTASDGLDPHCRSCRAAMHAHKQANDPQYREKQRAAALAYYATHKEERRGYAKKYKARIAAANKAKNADRVPDPSVMKRCAGQCQQILPETSFSFDRRTPDGLRAKCRVCAMSFRRSRQACREAHGGPVGVACYLCGGVIDAPSDVQVDHLIPQSYGGPDTADNVRWTHGGCNRERFNKPLTSEQLQRAALIGPLPENLMSGMAGE